MMHFKNDGHQVISLSQREGADLNPYLLSQEIPAYSYIVQREGSLIFFLKHLLYFIRFCYSNKVDFVFSHLDPANFVASMSQYFIRAKVYLCRHHINEAALYKYNTSVSYKLTNLLAKKFIVVSEASKKYMIEHEKVNARKLLHINLAYDFDLYQRPLPERVISIRKKYNSKILLITASRLTKYKRPQLSVEVVSQMIDQGHDVKLLILGTGEMHKELSDIIEKLHLQNSVFLLGHVTNVLDYFSAADFILHPSILESSCVVIKEAGLVKKPVLVCRDIGDFTEYIVDGGNGFLLDIHDFVREAIRIITKNHSESDLYMLGHNLHETVFRLFSINQIAHQYDKLLTAN